MLELSGESGDSCGTLPDSVKHMNDVSDPVLGFKRIKENANVFAVISKKYFHSSVVFSHRMQSDMANNFHKIGISYYTKLALSVFSLWFV